MRLHDIFFWGACFFLIGVFVASITSGFSQTYLITAIVILLASITTLLLKRPLLSYMIAVVLAMFFGAGYYFVFDHLQKPSGVIFDRKVEFTGVVQQAEQRLDSQKLVIKNIQITIGRYPQFEYGDKVKITGTIKNPPAESRNYFSKEGTAGLMSFPKIAVVSRGNGSPVKATLFKIKSFVESSFKKVLPLDQAAFLSGLTLGDTAEFSDDFKEKMRLSGTSHLVALSGYNISVLVKTAILILGAWWLTKKFSFPIITMLVLGFVVMTGAEASVVRAAIMAFLLLLSDKMARPYYFRNALVATALVMILINPKILAFDVGFQLSFAALLGIVYLASWLKKFLRMKDEPGFLNWRGNLVNTTSAQLAVLPLLIYHFSFFSPIGILSNLLILEFIPITMALGFFIAFAAATSYWFSWIIALPTSVFLKYELTVIDICSKIINTF